jgi:hypothetical protein
MPFPKPDIQPNEPRAIDGLGSFIGGDLYLDAK